jgi:hypothetical protein
MMTVKLLIDLLEFVYVLKFTDRSVLVEVKTMPMNFL